MIIGISREAGADEDDFHMFKRRKAAVEKDEKVEDRVKRSIDLKAGAHTGIVKSFGAPAVKSTKKVVYF
jgi:zinc finger CCHC domain-containing protein 9